MAIMPVNVMHFFRFVFLLPPFPMIEIEILAATRAGFFFLSLFFLGVLISSIVIPPRRPGNLGP